MRYHVRHRTSYRYDTPVSVAAHLLHLKPREFERQIVHRVRVDVHPSAAFRAESTDPHGNCRTYVSIEQAHDAFETVLDCEVEVHSPRLADPADTSPWEQVAEAARHLRGADAIDVLPFRLASPLLPMASGAVALAQESFTAGRPVLEAAFDLTQRITRTFAYDPTATEVSTPLAEVLKLRRGVCQDFAHVQIAALRGLGLPARYVSGYIRTYRQGGDALRGADASHAWVALWCGPVFGWIDLDPTNALIVTDEHITCAWGRDYADVPPVRGIMLGGGAHSLDVAVSVEVAGKN